MAPRHALGYGQCFKMLMMSSSDDRKPSNEYTNFENAMKRIFSKTPEEAREIREKTKPTQKPQKG